MTASAELADRPRTKLFLRGKSSVEAIWGPPSSSKDKTLKIERDDTFAAVGFADLLEFTSDGKLLVLVRTASGFTVHDSDSGAVVVDVANPGIHAVAWSPLGSHLLTWQRPQKDSDLGNLVVWDALTGQEVARFKQKSYTRDVRGTLIDESGRMGVLWCVAYRELTCCHCAFVLLLFVVVVVIVLIEMAAASVVV